MLDNDFLRGLGIKEELLPALGLNGDAIQEKESIVDLQLAAKDLGLSEEEIKIIMEW